MKQEVEQQVKQFCPDLLKFILKPVFSGIVAGLLRHGLASLLSSPDVPHTNEGFDSAEYSL